METWTIGHCLCICLVFLAGLLLLKFLFKAAKYIFVIFRDYFVLWNVAFGAHPTRRNISHRMRLHPYVCNPLLLDKISFNELFTFGKTMVATDITIDTFRKTVLAYKYVIIFRERLDGSLRGMCLLGKDTVDKNGQKCTILKMGLALFHNYYQGGPFLYYILLYHLIREKMFHPRTPLYVTAKLFSYKSYLVFVNSIKKVYPRYDEPIPDFERQILDDFAKTVCFPNEVYYPESFVLERELSSMKTHVAVLTERDLENPHIRFFATQNPGWEKGHCMFTIAVITWSDILYVILKSLRRAIRARKGDDDRIQHKNAAKFRNVYNRQLTYQSPEAKFKVHEHYTVEDGNVVLRKPISDDIYVPPDEDS